ncbi:MAG: flagellar hook-basal body complex protein FliE [Planctomycetota bacterium]
MDPLGLIPGSSTPGLQPIKPLDASAPIQGPSFKELMMKNIEQVNALQQEADMAIEDLAAGKRDDMDSVLMAKQKADVAFQMLLQVRNKMMDAYDEVKQIRV